jgi:UDP-GlcNAc:undecaprenyl-phosphate/decaprenyl-phosphate GlcNAc-1-phosphate transferase
LAPYIVVAAVAAAAAFAFTPVVRAIVLRLGALDVPTERKVHSAPTPTYGGIAIYLSFVAAFALAATLDPFRETFRFSEVFGMLVGGFVVLLLGIADDHRDLSPPAKLAGQIFAGGILYLSGVQMSFFWLPAIGVISLSPDISAVLTIIWIVLLTNAVNYIDGLDGLAAGLTAIAAGGLFLYSTSLPPAFLGPNPLAPLAAAALIGACIGFLPLNFYPARIFMGDTGAMPLGFFLAAATISMIGRFNGPGAAGGRLALPLIFTPIVFLALPLGNYVFVTIRRLRNRQPIMVGERDEHIHYRLLQIGHSHRRAVLVMYGWALLLATGLVVAGTISWGRFLLAFTVAAGMAALVTVGPWLRRGNGSGNERSGDEGSAVAPPPSAGYTL